VGEEVPHRDLLLSRPGEFGEILPDPGAENEVSLLNLKHRRGRESHDLGEGGKVVHGVPVGAPRHPDAQAPGAVDVAISMHGHPEHGARSDPDGDGGVEEGIE